MSILGNWYKGETFSGEKIIPKGAEYRSMSCMVGREREYFAEELPERDKERFEKWNEMIFDCEYIREYTNFMYGFRLGIMLAFEVFMEEEIKI